MPLFRIETNIAKSKVPADFLKTTTAVVAKTLEKLESKVLVQVATDQLMSFGGSTEPCANCFLMSIGKLGTEENKKHSKALAEHIEKNLGVPKNRSYITFSDESSANVGFDGTTAHELKKEK